MKKQRFIKRLVATVLTVTMLFSIVTTVMAEDIEPRYIPDAITLTINAGVASESSFGDNNYGHAYIGVENYTGRPIMVGKMSVPNGYGVSLGVFNGTPREAGGLYYNREFVRNDRSYWTYTTTITDSQLLTLSKYLNANDRWSLAYNCSVFAATAWNQVAKPQFASSYFSTPTSLAGYIQNLSGSTYGKTQPMYGGTAYYVENGKLIYSIHN